MNTVLGVQPFNCNQMKAMLVCVFVCGCASPQHPGWIEPAEFSVHHDPIRRQALLPNMSTVHANNLQVALLDAEQHQEAQESAEFYMSLPQAYWDCVMATGAKDDTTCQWVLQKPIDLDEKP
jgi:hypothetical protein